MRRAKIDWIALMCALIFLVAALMWYLELMDPGGTGWNSPPSTVATAAATVD